MLPIASAARRPRDWEVTPSACHLPLTLGTPEIRGVCPELALSGCQQRLKNGKALYLQRFGKIAGAGFEPATFGL